ncbi:MAG TPA: putative sulfate exporter family transporter, partial [Corynebacterium xerosis]|uniref:YeiH family protein n=1 Tax=Corynebacterium xerosis TaxID=1725 RepID=UPI001D331B48
MTAHIDHDRIPAMQANAVPAPESAPWAAPGPVAGRAAGSRASIWPGLLFAAAGVAVAYAVSAPFDMVGPMVAAIVLGVVVGNVARVPSVLEPGLAVASKRVLRIGIVVLGLRLSLHDVAGLGAGMILTVIAVVAGGIVTGVAIGRALGIGRRQRLLIACGIAICGAAAVAAVAGVLGGRADGGKVSDGEGGGNRERDGGKAGAGAGANTEAVGEPGLRESVAAAIALVVVFGTLMIALVPMLGHALGLTDMEVGMWGGASVHEVAQVVAIGGSVGGAALGAAVVIKLGRVLMLAPVMAVLGAVERRRIRAAGGGDVDLPPIMPLFVAGFLAMVAVRSTGVVPQGVLDAAGVAEQLLLGAAMFALGVGVRFSLIRKVGGAPVVMAAAATVVVAVIGLAGVL